MFIELHLLQNFAPSNLNRDDNNMPKDCVFGGVRRARVSSQSWKYAVRRSDLFKTSVDGQLGIRTAMLISLIKERMSNRKDKPEVLDSIVTAFVKAFAGGFAKTQKSSDGEDSKDKRTSVLLYLDQSKVNHMAQMLNDDQTWAALSEAFAQDNRTNPTKTDDAETNLDEDEANDVGDSKKNSALTKPIKKIVNDLNKESIDERTGLFVDSADIALFGSMLAAKGNNQNIEAACQVAHAISTHRVEMEMDFFTAMDDKLPRGAQGAGMIGQTDYNSSCYYRYARLDWGLLVDNLRGNVALARRAVKGFLLAFAQVTPSGKQKPFAALNHPDFVLAVVRNRGMGWSLANAFEKAIRTDDDGGYVIPSIHSLHNYYAWLKKAYDDDDSAKSTVTNTVLMMQPHLFLEHFQPLPSEDKSDKKDENKKVTENINTWAEQATAALTDISGT